MPLYPKIFGFRRNHHDRVVYSSLVYAPKFTAYLVFVYYKLPPQGNREEAA